MSIWNGLKRLLGGGTEASATQAEDLFAEEIAARIAKLPGVSSVARGEQFSVGYTYEGASSSAFLANLYAETRDVTADERTARVERFVSGLLERFDGITWADARDRLVPVLRPATTFLQTGAEPGKLPIRRRFLPFLNTLIGLDGENSFRYVSPDEPAKWGVDVEAVFSAAADTAARAFDGTDVEPYGGQSYPLWHVARDDSYETSRLLVPGWLASFGGKVTGRPIAIVPSRSRLIVGGDGDERCLAQLVESARREYLASPRNISPALYTVDDEGRVVPLVLPPGHPLARDVAIGHLTLAISEYTAQQDHLQPGLEDELFVAKLIAVEKKSGALSAVTTWTREAPSLLPQADEVCLVAMVDGEAQLQFTVGWQALLDLAGDCLRHEPGHDPPRWRTERWPDPVTFEKLRSTASS